MAYLIDLASPKRRFKLGGLTRIGRDPDNDICIADSMVSPRHAEVRATEDGFKVVDVGSRRGTFVAARRVAELYLHDGDEILVGVARLRFELGPAVTLASGSTLPTDGRQPTEVDDLRRDYAKLRAGVELTRMIGVEHDLSALLERILDAAFQLLAADRGTVVLLDPPMQVARRRDRLPANVVISTSLVSEVLSKQRGVITSDTGIDARFQRAASISAQGIRSAMCVPIQYSGELLGVLHLDSQAAINVFGAKDLELFTTIASQAALAIKNALLVKRAKEAAAEEAQRLERIVANLPAGVFLLDAERRILAANAQAAALLPALGAGGIGDRVLRLGSIGIDEILAHRGRAPLDVVVAGAHKRVFSVAASGADTAETVMVVREVTAERAEEASHAQQDRLALIGQLAGGIAHDFNNLLAVILNCARFAELEISEPEVREDVRQIRLAATRAAELTRQLLAFSRREIIRPRVVEPNRLVADAEKLLRRTLGEHIQLETTFGAGLPSVKVDPTKLEQVLLNLAVNARDAMVGGGELRITTSEVELDGSTDDLPPGRYVAVSVADTGSGMSPEVAARVFEPFFTTKEMGKGTGLGLATVYGIVKQAGGGITLSSELGRGTSFRVLLPASSDRPDEDEVRMTAPTGGRGLILVAEDEPGVRSLTKRILEQAGYTVLAAESGAHALELARQHPGELTLLLTDLVMPGMSGKQLAEQLVSERPGCRVLYMSGYFDDHIAENGLLADDVAFLSKPFGRDDLLVRVREAIAYN